MKPPVVEFDAEFEFAMRIPVVPVVAISTRPPFAPLSVLTAIRLAPLPKVKLFFAKMPIRLFFAAVALISPFRNKFPLSSVKEIFSALMAASSPYILKLFPEELRIRISRDELKPPSFNF